MLIHPDANAVEAALLNTEPGKDAGTGTPETPGPKPMIALKTLPDTSEAPPAPTASIETTRTSPVGPAPPASAPELAPPPPQQAHGAVVASPEGRGP